MRSYEKHGMGHTPEYATWARMKNRCSNKGDKDYAAYGGRGLRVEYVSFLDFYADVGPKPEGTSIERRDNDKGYCKGNCYWATPIQQAHNRRSTKLDERSVQLIRALYQAKAPSCAVTYFAQAIAPLFRVSYKTIFNVIYDYQW
jgi:hypothetical protein